MKKSFLFLSLLLASVLFFSSQTYAYSFKIAGSDWTVGGSLRLDGEFKKSRLGDVEQGKANVVNDMYFQIPYDSNLFIQAQYDRFSGYIEGGFRNPTNNKPYTREAYGVYDFENGFNLKIGQAWVLFATDSPNQRLADDLTLQGYGDLYTDKQIQVMLVHKKNALTWRIALSQPITNNPSDFFLSDDLYLVDKSLPALSANLTCDNGKLSITPSGYIQMYKLRANDESVKSDNVMAYGLAVDASYDLDFTKISAELWGGQNLSIFNLDQRNRKNVTFTFGAPFAEGDGNIQDILSWGGWLQFAIPVGPGQFFVGGGYQHAQVNGEDFEDIIQYNKFVATYSLFANYQWDLAKGFSITPEVAYLNNGKDALKVFDGATGIDNLGSDIYAGVHFQFDF